MNVRSAEGATLLEPISVSYGEGIARKLAFGERSQSQGQCCLATATALELLEGFLAYS